MNSRATRATDSKHTRGNSHSGPKRPTTLSLMEPTKKTENATPLLISVPPVQQRSQSMPCPISPMTPGLDVYESPGSSHSSSSHSSSSSSTCTFDLLSLTTPHHDRGFSFTACPSSPLDDSVVYAFPPRKRPASMSYPRRSWVPSVDHNDLSIEFATPLSEDPLKEGVQSPSDDRKYFHVRFLQEDSPFPKTPDY